MQNSTPQGRDERAIRCDLAEYCGGRPASGQDAGLVEQKTKEPGEMENTAKKKGLS